MERHNVGSARRIVEYGRRQSVEISLTGDPTTDLRYSRSRRIAARALWRGCNPGHEWAGVGPQRSSARYWRACRKANRAGGPMTARICIWSCRPISSMSSSRTARSKRAA